MLIEFFYIVDVYQTTKKSSEVTNNGNIAYMYTKLVREKKRDREREAKRKVYPLHDIFSYTFIST